ncbi:putative membrane protein isoform B [Chlorella sorokiniana]|uniref:Membrane protein isoform B n=1 Tax=Chlorella sorokiniana TaxID=3076 RepID=A0A2P6TP55_CHLSO|nr:putative membrane protein isoform B [Chlorella sorokiniana]|eukprot:PRW51118.1 putative membrane protein isoform B [Chlorella sorokiniana]
MAVAVVVDGESNGTAQEADSKVRRHPTTGAYIRSLAWVRPVLILAALYVAALSLIVLLFSRLPNLEQLAERHGPGSSSGSGAGTAGAGAEQLHLSLAVPHSFDELRAVRRTLELYRQNYAVHVAALLLAAHIFLQTFMIPGSILVNVLAGSMYSLPAATAFAATVDAAGASSNYWLARWLLRDVVAGLFPARVHAFALEMQKHHANLLNYNLFIRTAPIFPSWVINLASPIVGVPFRVFILALVGGHLPINFISVKAGHNLATMQSVSDMYSAGNVLFLVCAGSLALVPILLRRLRRGDRSARGHARPAGRAVQVVSLLPIVAHAGPGGGGSKAAGNGSNGGSGGSIAIVKQQLGAVAGGGGVPKLAVPAVPGLSPMAPKLSPAAKRTEGQHVL